VLNVLSKPLIPRGQFQQFTAYCFGSRMLRRAPDLADFGRTIRYLVETRSITGQVVALDGGQHLTP